MVRTTVTPLITGRKQHGHFLRLATMAVVVALVATMGPSSATAAYTPGIPAAVDPGTPVFAGSSTPVPAPPAAYDPTQNMLQAIYNADLAAGGTRSGSTASWLGRSSPATPRPCIPAGVASTCTPTRRARSASPAATRTASDPPVRHRTVHDGDLRRHPDRDHVRAGAVPELLDATFTATGLSVRQRKFITDNNVAVTYLTHHQHRRLVDDPDGHRQLADRDDAASGSELTGTVTARYGLTTMFPRFSGDSFTVSGTSLTRSSRSGRAPR